MFIYNNKEYRYVWFTSDEHYGSDRHILLSRRMDFSEARRQAEIQYILDKKAPDMSENMKKIIKNSFYGSTIYTQIDKMNDDLIDKHNLFVGDNDLVFHNGDFGDFKYSEKLRGDHILIFGNYEYDDCQKNYDGNIPKYLDYIKSYNFIDAIANYTFDLSDPAQNIIGPYNNKICKIYMTHKPEDCLWITDRNTGIHIPDIMPPSKYIMNLFGHIHEKGKIKRFGLNVGVDCHHYYPVSQEDVGFYLHAILHHYDENVFM